MIPKVLDFSGLRVLHWKSNLPMSGAPPIILLHGLGDGADIWRSVVDDWYGVLMSDVYAFDLPGHGGSLKLTSEEYNVKNAAILLSEEINANNINYPIIVGHSLGGRIVMEIVGNKLVIPHLSILVDINPDHIEDAIDAVDDHIDILINGEETTKALIDKIKLSLPLSDVNVLNKAIPALLSAGKTETAINKSMPFDPNVKSYMTNYKEVSEWALVEQIKTPLAFVRGSFSSVCDRKIDIQMANRASRFIGVEVVKGAGHAICLEQPKSLALALVNLINKSFQSA